MPAPPVNQTVTHDELLQVTREDEKVTELPPDRLNDALQQLQAVDSLKAFKSFYGRYQNCPKVHQDQIVLSADPETQARFYTWLDELFADPQTQKSVKVPAKWLVVNLGTAGETTVKVLSQKGNSFTVHVPGFGAKTIAASQVVRPSEYQGD